MSSLQGKVAVITGATSGMGFDTAKLFISEGAKVVITGRSQAKLNEAASQLSGDFIAIRADAASLHDSEKLIDQTLAHFGQIDILFLNAGIFGAYPVAESSEEFFDSIFSINTKGPYFTAKLAIPHLRPGASILFNTSVSNVKGMPGVSAYAASKAALRSIVRTLASELGPQGIRVNAVSPGPIETPIWGKTNLSEEEVNGFATGVSQQVPLGRFGKGTEVAETALFLSSDASSYINGAEIPVDGGMAQV
ncbi:MAG: glucose 1-dehydrogenase [Saprospiraceae bacterium]|nr:glucose 1-dehydrogenase [Saprospiraceae bacterium]